MLLLKLAIFQTAQAQARAIRLSLLIASQIRTRASIPPALAPDAPYAVGRRARTTIVLCLRPPVAYIRHGRDLPGVPAPLDFNPVPQVRRVVAAF